MPKKKKSWVKVAKESSIKIIEPEAILEREIAMEDQALRKAKVTEIFEGFREDREKRRGELRSLMEDLKMQRIKRREAMQKFMQGLRSKVVDKKRMMPEVRL